LSLLLLAQYCSTAEAGRHRVHLHRIDRDVEGLGVVAQDLLARVDLGRVGLPQLSPAAMRVSQRLQSIQRFVGVALPAASTPKIESLAKGTIENVAVAVMLGEFAQLVTRSLAAFCIAGICRLGHRAVLSSARRPASATFAPGGGSTGI